MSQQQDYDMDRQHVSPEGIYSDRTPTATGPSVDLSNLPDPSAGDQINYPQLQPTTSSGTSREYQPMSSFEHDAYRHEHAPSMITGVPKYVESIQRRSQSQPQIGLYSYSPATSYPDMSGNTHSNPGTTSSHDQGTEHGYPVSTTLYSSDTHSAPTSGGYRQAAQGVPSLDNMRLTDPMVVNYRQSMTSYHRRESESLQQRQQSQRQLMVHDGHAPEHLHAHDHYSQTSPISGTSNSRRGSSIPDIYLEYEMAASTQSSGKYSTSGNDNSLAASSVLGRPANASGLMQFGGDSYSTSHPSSSIPMSNSHPRHLYAGDVSGAQTQQQQYQPRDGVQALSSDGKRQEGQYRSGLTQLKQAPRSERQQPHIHQERNYQHSHSPNPDTNADVHYSALRGSSYLAPQNDRSHTSRPQHTHSDPHVRTLDNHANPRPHSMPDPPTSSHMLRPSSSLLSQSISPQSTSDNESGSESNIHEDDDRSSQTRRSGKGREGDFLRGHSYDSGGPAIDREEARNDGVGTGGQGDDQSEPPKKRKKSKMHECSVCHKKFPRPSGLKTHMNTHSNEKPFPCGFPGCTRTFGVRSNAKRHLRTHGIIPSSASNTVTETPYVVDFSTPLIMPPHPSNIPIAGPGAATSEVGEANASGAGTSDGRVNNAESSMPDDASNSTEESTEGHTRERGQSSRSAFKLRWMPLSLTSRSNATALRSAQDAGMVQRMDRREWALDGGQWSAEPRRGREGGRPGRDLGRSRTDSADEARDVDMNFDDAAMAARLTIPLQPVTPSHASPSPVGDHSDAGMSQSSDGLSLMGSSDPSMCVCNPPCPLTPDGLVRCLNVGALSFDALSPSNASASSPPNAPPNPTTFTSGNINYQEERNSYLPAGSHPYHSSQRYTPQP